MRLVWILAIVQFLVGEVHHTKEERHILPIFPALILLSAWTAARFAVEGTGRGWHAGVRRFGFVLGTSGLVLAGVQMRRIAQNPLPSWRASMPRAPGVEHEAIIGAVQAAVQRGQRVLLVGPFDLSPGPPVVDWDLVVDRRLLDVERSGAIGVLDRDRAVASRLATAPIPQHIKRPALRVLGRSDGPGLVRTLYAGLPEAVSPAAFARTVAESLTRGEVDVVIAATVVDERARFPRSYFQPALSNPRLVHASTRVVAGSSVVQIEEYLVR